MDYPVISWNTIKAWTTQSDRLYLLKHHQSMDYPIRQTLFSETPSKHGLPNQTDPIFWNTTKSWTTQIDRLHLLKHHQSMDYPIRQALSPETPPKQGLSNLTDSISWNTTKAWTIQSDRQHLLKHCQSMDYLIRQKKVNAVNKNVHRHYLLVRPKSFSSLFSMKTISQVGGFLFWRHSIWPAHFKVGSSPLLKSKISPMLKAIPTAILKYLPFFIVDDKKTVPNSTPF